TATTTNEPNGTTNRADGLDRRTTARAPRLAAVRPNTAAVSDSTPATHSSASPSGSRHLENVRTPTHRGLVAASTRSPLLNTGPLPWITWATTRKKMNP